MKKFLAITNFLNVIGTFLIVGFVFRLAADYYQFQIETKSEPFYLYIVLRGIVFLLPSIICFIAARYLKKRKFDVK